MRFPENLCMLLPKALKMRAIKQTMALITDSIGRTKCAPAQMPWHLKHRNPALLNRQGMSTHSKMENGSELCHRKGQLVIGLRASLVRPRKPPQIGAQLGTLRGSTTWRNVKAPPYRHVSGQHGLAKSLDRNSKMIQQRLSRLWTPEPGQAMQRPWLWNHYSLRQLIGPQIGSCQEARSDGKPGMKLLRSLRRRRV